MGFDVYLLPFFCSSCYFIFLIFILFSTYRWNPDGKRLGESAGYKELVKIDSTSGTWKGKPELTLATTTDTSKQRGDQSVRGQAAGWLNYGIDADGLKGNGHVGASDADGDHCFIAGWMVPEDHHYAITDSSITSTTQVTFIHYTVLHTPSPHTHYLTIFRRHLFYF